MTIDPSLFSKFVIGGLTLLLPFRVFLSSSKSYRVLLSLNLIYIENEILLPIVELVLCQSVLTVLSFTVYPSSTYWLHQFLLGSTEPII